MRGAIARSCPGSSGDRACRGCAEKSPATTADRHRQDPSGMYIMRRPLGPTGSLKWRPQMRLHCQSASNLDPTYCLTEECYRSRASAFAGGLRVPSRFAGPGMTEGGRSPTAVLPGPASDFLTSAAVVVAAMSCSTAFLRSAFRSRCTIAGAHWYAAFRNSGDVSNRKRQSMATCCAAGAAMIEGGRRNRRSRNAVARLTKSMNLKSLA